MLRSSARAIAALNVIRSPSTLEHTIGVAAEVPAPLLSALRRHFLHTASASSSAHAVPPIDSHLPGVQAVADEAEQVVRSEVDVEIEDPLLAPAPLPPLAPPSAPPGSHSESFNVFGRSWTAESGRLARLADGAATLRSGGTTALAAVSSAQWFNIRREATAPSLTVDYREKLYAVGRIPSTYNKREGAPKEHEQLAARRIERALRPLLPRGYIYDTSITTSILSADRLEDHEVLGINAASAALVASNVPCAGPLGAARVAVMNGRVVVGPPPDETVASEMSLLVAVTDDRIVLLEIEGTGNVEQPGVPEELIIEALRAGVNAARALLPPLRKLASEAGRQKRNAPLAGADPAAARRVADMAQSSAAAVLRSTDLDCIGRTAALVAARAHVSEATRAAGAWRAEMSRVPGSGCVTASDIDHAFRAAVGSELRSLALQEGLRPDGRGLIDLRPWVCDVDHVPVVHGSAVVDAGETQVLSTVTVGTKAEQQRMESLLGGDASKRLFVHFSLPEFAIGTAARDPGGAPLGPIMRHEMDRSEFVERALTPVLPSEEAFPFTFRLNAETLAADGGSGAAAVCSAALALADAGVPLRAMVAAVSIGLVSEGGAWNGEAGTAAPAPPATENSTVPVGRYELLTDPIGAEVALGDMQMRVAGTATGVTAVQLDVRIPGGVPLEIIEEALQHAKLARGRVLADMQRAIPTERVAHAPAFGSVKILPTMLGRVIGKEAVNLRAIEAANSARVQVDDDGTLSIFAPSVAQVEAAKAALLSASGGNLEHGIVYKGTVMAVKDFGAFIRLPGSDVDALLHVSEVALGRIKAVEDVLSVGEQIDVEFVGRDPRGGLRVSRKAVLLKQQKQEEGQVEEGQTPVSRETA